MTATRRAVRRLHLARGRAPRLGEAVDAFLRRLRGSGGPPLPTSPLITRPGRHELRATGPFAERADHIPRPARVLLRRTRPQSARLGSLLPAVRRARPP